MSALSMILTAAMVVPGDVPEKVSGEMVQGLDSSGRWEGSYLDEGSGPLLFRLHQRVAEECEGSFSSPFVLTDEGDGRVHLTWGDDQHLGIYRQEGDRLAG